MIQLFEPTNIEKNKECLLDRTKKAKSSKKSLSNKCLAIFVSVLFLFNQIIPPVLASTVPELEPSEAIPFALTESGEVVSADFPVDEPVVDPTIAFFLDGANALNIPTLELEDEADNSDADNESRDLPEYSFDEALAYLTPDYAAAVSRVEAGKIAAYALMGRKGFEKRAKEIRKGFKKKRKYIFK